MKIQKKKIRFGFVTLPTVVRRTSADSLFPADAHEHPSAVPHFEEM